MNHTEQRLASWLKLVTALGLIGAAAPAHAEWQSARTEGGIAAFNNDGKPAVPAVIVVCQKGTVFLYVSLAMDPEQSGRTIGFQGYTSKRSSEESFVRDASTRSWVTQPSAATLGLFNDDEFTLSVTLNGMGVVGVTTRGYGDFGPDPNKGINAALRPVFAACPNWRQQSSAALAPSPDAQAHEPVRGGRKKGKKGIVPVAPQPPAAAPAGRPPAQPAASSARIPLAVGYYAYVDGTFSSCANPVITPWYFDGTRFWVETDITDPSHRYSPEAQKWEMVAADRFRITYRSRNERGQWDSNRSVNEYVITGPQSFTFVGTLGGTLTANERHELCTPSQLPAKARWYKGG
jgi:hypothetical protein